MVDDLDDLAEDFTPRDPAVVALERAVRGERAPDAAEVAAYVEGTYTAIVRAAWSALDRGYEPAAPLLSILVDVARARLIRDGADHA